MDERRRCRLRGRVYLNNGRKSRRCSIRDISYEGAARIDLTDPIGIPDVIDLYIPQKHRRRHSAGDEARSPSSINSGLAQHSRRNREGLARALGRWVILGLTPRPHMGA